MRDIGSVVCAIIEQGENILIAQRPPGKNHAGEWEFPGGKVMAGEEPEQAIVREIEEELGVQVGCIEKLTPLYHEYTDFSLTLIPFRCHLIQGTPQALEHSQILWLSARDCLNYSLAAADLLILQSYLAILDL